MVKYYCDRCQKELSKYEYENEALLLTLLSQSADNTIPTKTLCSKCENELLTFLKGEKTK